MICHPARSVAKRRAVEGRTAWKRIAALAAALLAACSRGGAGAAPHALTIADVVDPASLNPLLAHDQYTIGYDLLVTETLVGLSADNRLVPVLVTRVPSRQNGDVSPDGRTIVYRLRQVRFADGRPLTSADVAFTYRAILDPRNPVESQDAYRRIASLQTPDARTVVIRLRRRWNAAVAELFAQADFAFGILPAHAFASTDVTRADWNQHPFGTGPFQVVEWERANRIVLEANPYYRPRPKLRRIVLALIPSTQASLTALRTGEVDVAPVVPSQVPQARAISRAHLLVTPVNGEYMLLVQTTAAPTDQVAVRRAIAAAIDPAQIVRSGFGTLVPADSFLPPVFAWHVAVPNTARPARVATLLSAVGWRRSGSWWFRNGQRLAVTITLAPEGGTTSQVIEQEQLRRAGIDAALKPVSVAQFNAVDGPLRSGHFTLAMSQWIGAADPEQSVIFACGQRGPDGNNAPNYCSPQFDALFSDQATTADPQRRRRDFAAMQALIAHDVPIVPIAFESTTDLLRDRVSGFRRNMLMYPVDPASWDAR